MCTVVLILTYITCLCLLFGLGKQVTRYLRQPWPLLQTLLAVSWVGWRARGGCCPQILSETITCRKVPVGEICRIPCSFQLLWLRMYDPPPLLYTMLCRARCLGSRTSPPHCLYTMQVPETIREPLYSALATYR